LSCWLLGVSARCSVLKIKALQTSSLINNVAHFSCPQHQPSPSPPPTSFLTINPHAHLTTTPRQRTLLLAACHAVIYTPQHEHFGIVPLEAMAARRPVVACNNGGPTESVVDGVTGLLAEPTPAAFALAFQKVLSPCGVEEMGRAARAHVAAHFSRAAFGEKLEDAMRAMLGGA